ncbi:hypothetical protein C2E23DRAFT_142780 [Lenzites betulinus]|nr:hypothetical protein C2E23DRAFT_142780 [Lenzites betulinus]
MKIFGGSLVGRALLQRYIQPPCGHSPAPLSSQLSKMTSLRLPAYRGSHGRRFHPYGRARRATRAVDWWMASMDDWYMEEPREDPGDRDLAPGSAQVEEVAIDMAENEGEEDAANLERALHLGDSEERRTLSTLFLELALAVSKALCSPLTVLKRRFSIEELNTGAK